jgi:hypothetical protein
VLNEHGGPNWFELFTRDHPAGAQFKLRTQNS